MKSTYTIATMTTIVLVTWLMSGQLDVPEATGDADVASTPHDDIARVQTRLSQAMPYTVKITASGQTEAKRLVKLRAESSGRIVNLPVEKGTRVKKGELLCQLALDDRQIKLDEARSNLRHARLEHQGLTKLSQQGFQGEVQIAAAEVRLIKSRANLKLQELNLAHRQILAPFEGLVQERPMNIGDYLQLGQVCAEVLDPDPILIVAHVTEQELGDITLGGDATVAIRGGVHRVGRVSFISHAGDPVTRTYRIEIEVDNSDFLLRDGLSAEVVLTQGTVMAHNASPASLSLDDAGAIGAKVVDADNIVRFIEVQIVSDTATGVWLTGLPATAEVITVGQELVFAGQQVETVPAKELNSGS
ncbi:MAG: efflux RND transporter periplasmic adaptor subunit [Gammaproteobacteria bacterium]|nr:efflux RND transporter periplasmic adaptor subunit [Gammaproteobacteria bacterium]